MGAKKPNPCPGGPRPPASPAPPPPRAVRLETEGFWWMFAIDEATTFVRLALARLEALDRVTPARFAESRAHLEEVLETLRGLDG